MAVIPNPFRPGAGQSPLYLAGRSKEEDHFLKMLNQRPVMRNLILTGLRGVGKTVLLENLKPRAQNDSWLWTGTDLTESASLTEERIAKRLVTGLSVLLSPILVKKSETLPFGFNREVESQNIPVSFDDLWGIYNNTPGLIDDKIKAVLLNTRNMIKNTGVKGIVFAYDEAQNLSDHSKEKEFPLSILLDVFASLQRNHHEVQIILILTGLPTLFPRLNEARTYSERMFDVITLDKLSDKDSREAILKPIEISKAEMQFKDDTVDEIARMSGGYPYFIQYICKEVYDAWISQKSSNQIPSVAKTEILSKLDQDFFSPRWERATDRQQQFMYVISNLEESDAEFTTQDIVKKSKEVLEKGFSASHATQILSALLEKGLVYRNKHGKYSFAVPLMSDFIRRQQLEGTS